MERIATNGQVTHRQTTLPRSLLAASLALLLAIIASGAWFYRTQTQALRHEIDARLQGIARLKVDQVALWRQEQLTDAQAIMDNPFVVTALAQWLDHPSPAAEEQTKAWFLSLRQNYHYADVLLADPTGRILFSSAGHQHALGAAMATAIKEAIATGRPVLTDLHRPSDDSAPHQETVAPLHIKTGDGIKTIGAIILQSNADRFLFPLIQSWPEPSATAETLLVRRDGGDALFLNELRHRQNTALRLRIPLTSGEVPAVKAMLGVQGQVEGVDYRGVPVFAVLSPIPETPWVLIAKIDRAEALADWQAHALLLIGLIVGVGGSLIAALGMVWQRYAKKQYRAAYRAEVERRQAEEQYRATLMSVGDRVIACDNKGMVTVMNPVAEIMTGWLKEEAAGQSIDKVFVILNEDSRLPVKNPVERVLREGLVVGLANHTVLVAADGGERPIADSGAPIFNDQGEISGAVLVFRDQTEERQAEARLNRANSLLGRAEEMADMGWWEFDMASRVVTTSPSARRIYGLSGEAWPVEDVQQIPLPEYRPALDQALKALIAENKPYALEFTIRRPADGALAEIRSQAQYDPKEQKVFGIIEDITAWRQAQAALLEREARYRSLFQGNHAAMWLVDQHDGAILDANPAAVKFYGWSKEELLTMKVSDINMLAPEQLQALLDQIKGTGRNVFELQHRLAGGAIRDVEVFTSPISIDGRDCLYSAIHDITGRKQAEEMQRRLREQLLQAQKLESVGRLAGGVAHDLNNMLSPILGYSDVLLGEMGASDPQREYVQHINQAGIRARDLVRQLLAFGRKQTLDMVAADLNQIVAGFLKLLQRAIREDIALETALAPALPAVQVDPGQIEQVIMNLVINAQDAMPGGGRILLETDLREFDEEYTLSHAGVAPGKYVALIITDTGFGMSPEVREQIFSPFFTTKEKGKGTGLGLAMVYGIVKQHGGHIWVYSEPEQGSSFKIYLPAVDARPKPVPVEPGAAAKPAGGHETVMVVEDNEMVRQLAVEILTRRGYAVLEAEGGPECLQILADRQIKPDLLLTDVVMPEMNGKALFKQAVQLVPSLKVLYMSGYTENVIASQGVLDEGVQFLQKPFSPQALALKIRQVLDRGMA